MSEVKLEQNLPEDDSPLFPKPNPYLLQEIKEKFDLLEASEKKVEALRKFQSLSPEEKEALKKAESEKLKEEGGQSAAVPTEAEVEAKKQPRSWFNYLVFGEEADKQVERVQGAAEAVVNVAKKGASLVGVDKIVDKIPTVSLTRYEVDPEKDLREAEAELYGRKFAARKLVEQLEKDSNPFLTFGAALGDFNEFEGYFPGRYYERSAQEAMQILSTVLVAANDIAKTHSDPELDKAIENLMNTVKAGTKLTEEDFKSLGYKTDEKLTDEQLAEKWGLTGMSSYNAGILQNQGKLPEMFFDVQKMLSSYNVLQALSAIEGELKGNLQEIEQDSTLTPAQKATKRRERWNEVFVDRITGSVKEGDAVDGVKTKTTLELYGAAILSPLLLDTEVTIEQATIFRLLVEKDKRAGVNEEQSHRLVDAYTFAETSGQIRDQIADRFGKKVSDLSNQEIENALLLLAKTPEYSKIQRVFVDINNNLPVFIELSRALEVFKKGMDIPAEIDTALTNQTDYELLFKEIQTARKKVEEIITNKLQLPPEQAVKLAEQFVERNEGRITEAEKQIPQRIKLISERAFGGDGK